MAIPAVAERTLHWVIDIAGREWSIHRQQFQRRQERRVNVAAVRATLDATEIPPELYRSLDVPQLPASLPDCFSQEPFTLRR